MIYDNITHSQFNEIKNLVEKYITNMYNGKQYGDFYYGRDDHYFITNTKDGIQFNSHLIKLIKLIKEDEIFSRAFNIKLFYHISDEVVKNIGDIDGKRYYSNVTEEDMIYYNKCENKMLSVKEKANNYKDEKNINKQIKYMEKYNKYQKNLIKWVKKHPVKWYNKKDEEDQYIRMKTF